MPYHASHHHHDTSIHTSAGSINSKAMNGPAEQGIGPFTEEVGIARNFENRPNSQDISRLAPADKHKVMELAQRMLQNANEANKAQAREQIRAKISPQQLQEWQEQGRDPLALFYQQQAFNMLRANAQREEQQTQRQNDDALAQEAHLSGHDFTPFKDNRDNTSSTIAKGSISSTISKDNTLGDPARDASLLASYGQRMRPGAGGGTFGQFTKSR